MGIGLVGHRETDVVCFYCTTTDWAFGPVMGSEEEAESFSNYLGCDPRTLTEADLRAKYAAFVRETVCECGTVRTTECTYCNNSLFEPAVNGMHREDDDFSAECEIQPAPKAGERWACPYCQRKAARSL